MVATITSELYSGEPRVYNFDLTDLLSLSGLKDNRQPWTVLKSLGPFEFELYWFNRQRLKALPDVGDRNEVRALVKAWTGICLYRDGYRVLPYGGEGDDWLRRRSASIANRVRNRLSDESVQDSGCTFRAFRRECLRDLVLYRGFHRFIPTLLKMKGYRVIEVEVSHRPRRFGRSKYGVWNRAFVAFVDLLVVRWMKSRRLRYEVAEDLGGGLVRE